MKPVSLLLVHLLTISLAFAQNNQPATPSVSYEEGSENILFLINNYPLVTRRYGDFRWTQVMNILDYKLLKRKEISKAFAVFELTFREYPDKLNTCDSLGDGYFAVGDKIKAMASFKKAIELDPGNEAGKFKLNDLTKNELD